ncbi:MAG: hypothetical protein Q9214_004086 [Letrouitia sp. 1 TL-2023]
MAEEVLDKRTPGESKLVSVSEAVDVRVTDILVAGGFKDSDDSLVQLRRGLSQRSLAFQFEDWELENNHSSTITERARDINHCNHREGRINDYLRAKGPSLAGNHVKALSKALGHGIKLLVCEKILGGPGHSALLIFRYSQFRSLHYKDLPDLNNAVSEQQELKDIIQKGADWLPQWQIVYDIQNTIRTGYNEPDSARRRKRMRCSSPQSWSSFTPPNLQPTSDTDDTDEPTERDVQHSPNCRASGSDSSNARTLPFQDAQSLAHELAQQHSSTRYSSVELHAQNTVQSQHNRNNNQHGQDASSTNGRSESAMGSAARQDSASGIQNNTTIAEPSYQSPYPPSQDASDTNGRSELAMGSVARQDSVSVIQNNTTIAQASYQSSYQSNFHKRCLRPTTLQAAQTDGFSYDCSTGTTAPTESK